MVTHAQDVGESGGVLRRIHSPPLLGLTALGITLLWKPVAHALTVTLHGLFTGPIQYLVAALIGLGGFTLGWQGIKLNGGRHPCKALPRPGPRCVPLK